MEFVPEYSFPERPEGRRREMLVVPPGGDRWQVEGLGDAKGRLGNAPQESIKRSLVESQ